MHVSETATEDLRRIARIAINAKRCRLESNITRAEFMEEKAEEAMRRLLEAIGAKLTRQCALSVVNACIFWGAAREDYEAVLDGTEDDIEFVVDALFTEWECSAGGSEDTAFDLELPTWRAVEGELRRAPNGPKCSPESHGRV